MQDGFPFSYNAGSAKQSVAAKQKSGFFHKSAPIILGGAGIGFAIVSAVSAEAWFRARADYEDETGLSRQKTLKEKGRVELPKTVVFGSLSAVAIPVALVIYFRNNEQADQESRMTVTPVVNGRAGGVVVTLSL